MQPSINVTFGLQQQPLLPPSTQPATAIQIFAQLDFGIEFFPPLPAGPRQKEPVAGFNVNHFFPVLDSLVSFFRELLMTKETSIGFGMDVEYTNRNEYTVEKREHFSTHSGVE